MLDPNYARTFAHSLLTSLSSDWTIERSLRLFGQRNGLLANCKEERRRTSLDGAVVCDFAQNSISKTAPIQIDDAGELRCGPHVGSHVRSIAYPRVPPAKSENALSVECATADLLEIGNLSSPVYWDTS